jgi:hypothetical protein
MSAQTAMPINSRRKTLEKLAVGVIDRKAIRRQATKREFQPVSIKYIADQAVTAASRLQPVKTGRYRVIGC